MDGRTTLDYTLIVALSADEKRKYVQGRNEAASNSTRKAFTG